MELVNISSKLLEKINLTDYPRAEKVIGTLDKLRVAIFPGYFFEASHPQSAQTQIQPLLAEIQRDLADEIASAFSAQGSKADAATEAAGRISAGFIENLPAIQQLLYKDAQAGFDGDPAARSVDEVILTYPGFYAVFTHRIAHYLFREKVPLIPRMISEHAHSITGIDIHPGAQIGEYFFIDHGTGVVIGETSIIGDRVKLYQGVTIGALSTVKTPGYKNVKRHPTIKDHVTVYSGASILGGDTVIGEGAVIGGNAFIVRSVPAKTVVKAVNPELQYNDGGDLRKREFKQPNAWFYQI